MYRFQLDTANYPEQDDKFIDELLISICIDISAGVSSQQMNFKFASQINFCGCSWVNLFRMTDDKTLILKSDRSKKDLSKINMFSVCMLRKLDME